MPQKIPKVKVRIQGQRSEAEKRTAYSHCKGQRYENIFNLLHIQMKARLEKYEKNIPITYSKVLFLNADIR